VDRTLTIRNLTRQQLVLNLPSGLVPEMSRAAPVPASQPLPRARRVGDKRVDIPGAPVRPAPVASRLSGSVTLNARGTPGDTVRNLPPSAKRAPDVQAALSADPPRVRVDLVVAGAQPEPQPRVRVAQERQAQQARGGAK
jgi:hypothetical protein